MPENLFIMKTFSIVFFYCQILFFAIACNHQGGDAGLSTLEAPVEKEAMPSEEMPPGQPQDFDETPPPPAPPQQPQSQPAKPETPIPRQIIKTANYRIRVEDVNASSQRAGQLALKHGGYVSGTELTNSSYEITNAITIRVPANRFDSLLNDLGGDAIFTQYKKVSSQDVTEEYVDVTTRLKTKKEVRDRYIDILRNKAKTVEDVLKAEEQIRIIQEEIEAKEGRLRYLKDQVAMSTIYLELYQSIDYRPEPTVFRESFGSKLLTALKNGWELLQGIAVVLVTIWPLLILGGLLWWRRRWIWQRIRRK
jgi:hypothetical protein